MFNMPGHGRMTIDERPGLSVAWAEQDRRSVQRELTRLSPTLFLHRERDVWTVKDRVGENLQVPVVVWQASNGQPLPLSMGIVDAVRQQEKRQKTDEIRPAEMAAREQDRRQRIHERTQDELEQTARVNERRLSRVAVPISTPLDS